MSEKTLTLQRDLRSEYLLKLIQNTKYVPFNLLQVLNKKSKNSSEQSINLNDVFIDVDVSTPNRESTDEFRHNKSLAEIWSKEKFIILCGEFGSGKTTVCKNMIFCLANQNIDNTSLWSNKIRGWPTNWNDHIPVNISLTDVYKWLISNRFTKSHNALLSQYLKYYLANIGIEDYHPALIEAIISGNAIVFFDGIDEIPFIDDSFQVLIELIQDFQINNPLAPVVVTCGHNMLSKIVRQNFFKNVAIVEIAPLSREQALLFITKYSKEMLRLHISKNSDMAKAEIDRLLRSTTTAELSTCPLFLATMIISLCYRGAISQSLTHVLDDITKVVWGRARVNKEIYTIGIFNNKLSLNTNFENQINDYLMDLALTLSSVSQKDIGAKEEYADWGTGPLHFFTIQRSSIMSSGIKKATAIEMLGRQFSDLQKEYLSLILQYIIYTTHILREAPDKKVYFTNRALQEYYGAKKIANCINNHESIQLYLKPVKTRDIIPITFGILRNPDVSRLISQIHELSKKKGNAQFDETKASVLIGQGLIEVGASFASKHPTVVDETINGLVCLITNANLPLRDKLQGGTILSVLGDPRDFEEMIVIPAGSFIMGSDNEVDDEMPQHTCSLPSYSISKYPITNGLYAEFIKETGHRPPLHWNSRVPPRDIINHSVTYVSWHDACAYAEWLSHKKSAFYRLPTEAEWEKAARGIDGRIYPWGNELIESNCNMKGTGVNSTAPVGIFEEGNSPFGCCDMAGNVWEWTISLWGKTASGSDYRYPYDPSDGREDINAPDNILRVIKGGAFFFNRGSVRCAFRGREITEDLSYNFGFRVVRVKDI